MTGKDFCGSYWRRRQVCSTRMGRRPNACRCRKILLPVVMAFEIVRGTPDLAIRVPVSISDMKKLSRALRWLLVASGVVALLGVIVHLALRPDPTVAEAEQYEV